MAQYQDGTVLTLQHFCACYNLGPETLKKLEGQNSIPENCERIQVPKVNKELWKGFQSKTKRN